MAEADLVRAMMSALRRARPPGEVWVLKTHGSSQQRRGVPDILGCYAGCHFAIEVKVVPGEQPTDIQLYEMEKIRKAGGVVIVAYTVAEAINVLSLIDRRYGHVRGFEPP